VDAIPSDKGSDEKYPDEKNISRVSVAPLGAPIEDKSGLPFWKRFKRIKLDPNAIATQESVFDDPILANYYQPRAE
jgi:hypothetical protein